MSFICFLRLIGLLPEIHSLCSTKLTALAASRLPRRWSYDQKTAGLASKCRACGGSAASTCHRCCA